MAKKQIRLDRFNRIVDENGKRKKRLSRAESDFLIEKGIHRLRADQTPQMRKANAAAKRRRELYALDRGVSNNKSKTPPAGWRPSKALREKVNSGEVVLNA